jgi:hypothetical protein
MQAGAFCPSLRRDLVFPPLKKKRSETPFAPGSSANFILLFQELHTPGGSH